MGGWQWTLPPPLLADCHIMNYIFPERQLRVIGLSSKSRDGNRGIGTDVAQIQPAGLMRKRVVCAEPGELLRR